jgi:NAD(P)-dependent dehydrogenase (short-subunit alcohol dehydrogenase family)
MPYTNVACQSAFWKTLVQKPKFSTDNIPDLSQKVAIVTGANSGLGYATTVALASHGAHVFLACRSEAKALEAIARARVEIAATPAAEKYLREPLTGTASGGEGGKRKEAKLEFLKLDLNDMNSCAQAAKVFLDRGLPLHILINNGGIMTSPFALSADGIEQQFAVNHMGYV